MMTKSDLKPSMIVKSVNGEYGMIVELDKYSFIMRKENTTYLNEYNEDLTHRYGKDLDISEVYGIQCSGPFSSYMEGNDTYLIWRRETPKVELTLSEIEEKLGLECGTLKIKYNIQK